MKENEDFDKLYLEYIYNLLSYLTYFNNRVYNVEEDLIEDFNFKGLLNGSWGSTFLHPVTISLLNKFRNKWLEYKRTNNYGSDYLFCYFDKKWNFLINDFLIPALESMEKDFDMKSIKYTSFKSHYKPDARPTDEEIVKRIGQLYDLLIKNNIIKLYYMD